MHTAPELSIIIPASSGSTGLRQAIDSIGDFARCEILVVTERHAPEVPVDPRIVPLRAQGHGANAARNLGLAVARAPLVAFLNPQDRWSPGKLEAQLLLHTGRSGIGLSFTDHVLVGDDGRDHGSALELAGHFHMRHAGRSLPFALGEDALAQLFAEDVVGISTVMVQTALLRDSGGFDPGLAAAAPWDAWLRLSTMAPLACIPWVLAEQHLPPPTRLRREGRGAPRRDARGRAAPPRCGALPGRRGGAALRRPPAGGRGGARHRLQLSRHSPPRAMPARPERPGSTPPGGGDTLGVGERPGSTPPGGGDTRGRAGRPASTPPDFGATLAR